jgi:hypothetical protein
MVSCPQPALRATLSQSSQRERTVHPIMFGHGHVLSEDV